MAGKTQRHMVPIFKGFCAKEEESYFVGLGGTKKKEEKRRKEEEEEEVRLLPREGRYMALRISPAQTTEGIPAVGWRLDWISSHKLVIRTALLVVFTPPFPGSRRVCRRRLGAQSLNIRKDEHTKTRMSRIKTCAYLFSKAGRFGNSGPTYLCVWEVNAIPVFGIAPHPRPDSPSSVLYLGLGFTASG